ncbi:MAG: hypothetical protein ACRYFU_19245 [Janthinobacterium lividum]
MIDGDGKGVTDQEDRGVGWLMRPLHTLPVGLQWVLTAALACVTGFASWRLQALLDSPFLVADHEYYLDMARGQGGLVPQPFTSRPLAPLLARGLARMAHAPIEHGFVLLGFVSLLATLLVVFALAMRTAAPRWLLLALAVTPFWPQLLHALALPDTLSAALLGGLLLCLAADRPLWAAVALCPLMVARESTSLALFCLLAVGWRQLRWWGCGLAVAAVAAGSAIVRAISPGVVSNMEHLPTAVYLAAKVPWNLLRLVGIAPWSNLYPYLCTEPLARFAIHAGPLRELGVCDIRPLPSETAAMALLTTFGLLPGLCVLLWRRLRAARQLDLLTRFCLLYGGFSAVLAPLIGTGYSRLFGYAWPMFLVAVPRLFPGLPDRADGLSEGSGTGAGRRREGGDRSAWAALACGGMMLLQAGLGGLALLPPRAGSVVWAGVLATAGMGVLLLPRSGLLPSSKTV